MGLIRLIFQEQNFIIMASGLLVEYAWLLCVILISLLIRLNDTQVWDALRIYAPLLAIGFLVISFRIVLVPNDMVNLIFPPILLICAIWQWIVIRRHNSNIPKSDTFYSYVSLVVFVASVVCSWIGYTLLSVQLLIWWIMQLTCILTITCIRDYLKQWAEKRDYEKQPINKTWLFNLFYTVILPVMGIMSIIISIYWAADVFNLSDTTMDIFRKRFIDSNNIKISIFSISQVVTLWFVFSYINRTLQDAVRLHFYRTDKASYSSRTMMAKNIIQLLVWGLWLLISLGLMHVNNTWLVVVSGGLSTGIGFAMKDIIENIYYGISLMAGRVKVGDYIYCDGTRGRVSSISFTSTMLEAVDGSVIAFQNSQLFTKNYKNLTKNHGYELHILEVGVAYGYINHTCLVFHLSGFLILYRNGLTEKWFTISFTSREFHIVWLRGTVVTEYHLSIGRSQCCAIVVSATVLKESDFLSTCIHCHKDNSHQSKDFLHKYKVLEC